MGERGVIVGKYLEGKNGYRDGRNELGRRKEEVDSLRRMR